VSGATIEELASRTHARLGVLAEILEQEVRDGRVLRDDAGRYAIVPERFARESIEGLRQLRPLDTDDLSSFARQTSGRRRLRLAAGGLRDHERAALAEPLWNGEAPST
jgi:hypothetical protein